MIGGEGLLARKKVLGEQRGKKAYDIFESKLTQNTHCHTKSLMDLEMVQ